MNRLDEIKLRAETFNKEEPDVRVRVLQGDILYLLTLLRETEAERDEQPSLAEPIEQAIKPFRPKDKEE